MKTVKMIALKPIRGVAVGAVFNAAPAYARIWKASGHAKAYAAEEPQAPPAKPSDTKPKAEDKPEPAKKRAYKRRDAKPSETK